MKKQLLLSFIALFFGTFLAFSQTTPVCGGMFTDAEGPNLNYANNANVTTTICPNFPGELVSVNFNSFSLENNADFLSVYDGASTNAPLIGTFTGTNIVQQITSTGIDQSGCLTFVFTSDAANNEAGWVAIVNCIPNPFCQDPLGLAVDVAGNNATLNWPILNPNSGNGWEIQLSNQGIPVNTFISTTPVYTLTNLSPGVYTASVRALCNGNISNPVTITFIINNSITCQTPVQFSGGPDLTHTIMNLSWTEPSSATSWEVLATPCGAPAPTATDQGIPVTTSNHTFANLDPTQCYSFYVRSVCSSSDFSDWSAPVHLFAQVTCPPITSMGANTLSSTSAIFQWTNSSNASSWEVVALPCGIVPTPNTVGTITTTPSYTFTNLAPNTCYSLFVRTICSTSSISEWSTASNITTPGNPNPNPTCGGTFTDPAGAISNYANSSNVTTTICPSNPGELVTVSFTSFALENNFDFLKVYDGNSATAPQIGSYTGTTLPPVLTSSTGCLTFVFTSDSSVTSSGWVANVTCAPAPTCQKPTLLTATNITSTSITIGWTNNSNATNFEVIALPCGSPAPTTTTTGAIATSSNPYTFTGLNSATCYTFYVRALCSANEISAWSTAINGTTTITPPVCGGNFIDNGGIANYANSSDDTYIICPNNPGEVVTVTFTSFDTEVNYDGLYVFDGNSVSATQIASTNAAASVPGGLAGAFWGTTIPGPFTSSNPNGCLTFRFRSDSSVNKAGWIANITCGPAPTCLKPTLLTTSNITPTSITIGWTNNSNATNFEVVALPCGTVPSSTTTGIISTSSNPYTFTNLTGATCYSFYVRALCSANDVSAWSTAITGTTLIAPPICGGTFIDNGGLANYANSSDNTYTICPSNPGELVTVTFTTFDTEANWDGLYVFDGNSLSSPQIASSNPGAYVPGGLAGAYWGTTIPGPFTSSDPSGCLTFRFRSDSSVNKAGWTANVTCASDTDKITLISFVDSNNNGIMDTGESLFSNGSFLYDLNNTGTNINAYSPNGRYIIYDTDSTNSYDFNYEILPNYSPYYTYSGSSINDITIATGSGNQIFYFPVTLVQGYNDVTVSIIPMSPPRPGFSYMNKIMYKNIGLTPTSGTVTFVKPTQTTITTISQVGTVANTAGFTYAFTNLLPNETRIIYVTMSVPSIPTVNLNDVLTDSASITAPADDINLNNNAFSNSQIVVASWDPNDKMEAHGGKIQVDQFTSDDYLYYTIHFENQGTANAIDVKVHDVLDSRLDASSIRMISSSHNYVMNRIGSDVTWDFKNIELPPTSVSPDASSGYVFFKIKPNAGYAAGDIIPNTANIFFDTNPAIVTNTFNTEFITTLRNISFNSSNFMVYPNPATTFVQVKLQDTSENIDSISLTDLLGKTIKTINSISSNSTTLDVSDVAKGIYMIEITTDSKLKQIKKLIIE